MASIGDRKLKDFSDQELEAEARRRRMKRTGARSNRPRHILRHLAALELSDSATRSEVEAAYLRLIDKYDPEKRKGDPKKFDAAQELTRSLTRAYRTVLEHLDKQK